MMLWDWLGAPMPTPRWAGGSPLPWWLLRWPLGVGLLCVGSMTLWISWIGKEMRR